MAQYQLVSRQAFAGKFWQRSPDYAFATNDAVCALLAQELPKAVMHMPVAFMAEGEQFVPVALQGLQPGQNAFVAPDGRWLLPYIPAAYRGHPFRVAHADNDQYVLCFDMDSGLLADSGEAFFAEDGSPAPFLNEIAQFLQACEVNRTRTLQQAALLKELGLLAPWPITVKDGEQEKQLAGIYRIDETALNGLPVEQFERLRQCGALVMVYCQLLSMQHLARLGDLLRQQAAVQQQMAASQTAKELDLSFMSSGDTLSFGTF
ncbi:SapC family protein [Vogesella indigofera]|uniref:SapC family protein n=1 Tax=Vogesella indigofera TaxID=45465 RepID=UPI00234CD752|nr:SapC family protein [Vogesella indigofera]MDC7702723.1 SapC family protein [Vogesella indigofera]